MMNVQQIKSKVKDKNLHRNSRTKAKSPQSSIIDCVFYPMKTFVHLLLIKVARFLLCP